MQNEVQVIITGLTGSGKSAIYAEIAVALQAIGVPVVHADAREFQSECNMTGGDTMTALEMYQPTVVLSEVNLPREQSNG